MKFLPPIPKGYQIYESRLEVAGIQHRKDSALNFAKGSNQIIELEREKSNKHDPNAIKVIGVSKGWFFTKRNFIGYVPKEVSAHIIASKLWSDIQTRLEWISVSDNGYVSIIFQLIGPKSKKDQYK